MSEAVARTSAQPRYRKSPAIYRGLVLWDSQAESAIPSSSTLSWGTGAPNHTAAIGAVYIRLANASAGTVFYRNTDGGTTWEAVAITASVLGDANTWLAANAFGVDGTGVDVTFYGDTATRAVIWDQSEDTLRAQDNTKIGWGSGAGTTPDIGVVWDGTKLVVSQLTANSAIDWGVDGAGIDQVWYGDTASAALTWDQSADSLILSGVAKIKLQTIVAATGAAIPVTHSGSFPITQNGAETNTLAIPTFLGQTMSIFVDTDTSGARVITSAQRINQAGNTIITMTEVGDFIKLEAISIGGALRWQVISNDGCVLT